MSEPTAWLLLSVGEERQHGGNDGYDDDPSTIYRWDSTVAHHADVQPGDVVVLWDKNSSLGASVVDAIATGARTKQLRKCPHCGKAGIKARKATSPKYKCYKCGETFDEPTLQSKDVITYESDHGASWVDLSDLLPGPVLRGLCFDPKSQQSMRPLRWDALAAALAAAGQSPIARGVKAASDFAIGGGHVQRMVALRVGQPKFRKMLVTKYGAVCAFTGPSPLESLEACHLYSYAKVGQHHSDGGVLLRRDLHRLFDLGFLSVNPSTLKIDVHADLEPFALYNHMMGSTLHITLGDGERAWLKDHWTLHRG